MYLPTIEHHDPSEAAGRFGRAILAARERGTPIPQIYHLFAFRPQAARFLNEFMEEAMRGPSPLSAGERELIAAWTSARNGCRF
jgi:alkylhydroperoxidase family enzyme